MPDRDINNISRGLLAQECPSASEGARCKNPSHVSGVAVHWSILVCDQIVRTAVPSPRFPTRNSCRTCSEVPLGTCQQLAQVRRSRRRQRLLAATRNTPSVRLRVLRLLHLRAGRLRSSWKRRSSTPAFHATESQALLETQAAGAEIALERGRASGLSSRGASTSTTTARRRALAMRSRVRATLRMGLTASTSRLLRAELCDWPKRSSAISSRMRSRTLNNGAIGNLASFG